MDRDRNGTLNREELATALSRLGLELAPQEAEELVMFLDGDGDGLISKEDFINRTYQFTVQFPCNVPGCISEANDPE